MSRRPVSKVVGISAAMLVVSAGAALADSGTFVSQAGQVVFYYGASAGSGTSRHWSGGFTDRFCEDAPGAGSNNTFVGKYRRDRTLQTDDIIKDHSARYSDGKYTSASFSTSGSSKYHTDVGWSYVAAASSAANGYSRGNGGC